MARILGEAIDYAHRGQLEATRPVCKRSAVEACFLLTLRAVAKASKVDLRRERTVDCQNGVTRFTEIVRRPLLELVSGSDRDRALRVLEAPHPWEGEGGVKKSERRKGMTPRGRGCAPSSAGGS